MVRILAAVFVGGGLVLGGAVWWEDYRAGEPAGQWMGAIIALATLTTGGWFACHVDRHAAPAPFIDTESGSLVIPQSWWTGMSRIALTTPWGVFWCIVTWREPAVAVFTVPLIAYLLGPVALRITGRWAPGGLRLDAQEVTYRSPGSERRMTWDQIAATPSTDRHITILEPLSLTVQPVPGLALRAAEGTVITTRRRTPLWRYGPERSDAIFIRTETLGVSLADLEHFCDTLRRWPRSRAQLADPSALEGLADPRAWRRRFRS